jgi:hypothetical protein
MYPAGRRLFGVDGMAGNVESSVGSCGLKGFYWELTGFGGFNLCFVLVRRESIGGPGPSRQSRYAEITVGPRRQVQMRRPVIPP